MRNRLLSGWRQYVLFAVVASFVLSPAFADVKDKLTPLIDSPEVSQGVQQVDRSDQGTVSGLDPMTLYARSNYVWPYSVATPYGAAIAPQNLRAQGVLRTMVGTFSIADLAVVLCCPKNSRRATDSIRCRCSTSFSTSTTAG